jgi:hypothetical protein
MTTSSTAIDPRFSPVVAGLISQGSSLRAGVVISRSQNAIVLRAFDQPDRVSSEFKKHERRWLSQTRHISSPFDKYLHPSYARIIGLGWAVVPHLLNSLKRQPNDWFYALRAVTGENPVPNSASGDVRRMANLWIAWGEARGLI